MQAGKQRHDGGGSAQEVAAADLRHHALVEALEQRRAAAAGPVSVGVKPCEVSGLKRLRHDGFLQHGAARPVSAHAVTV